MCLTIKAQKRWVLAKLSWSRKMITDGNSNPHEEMKRARNDKKEG